MRGLGAALMLAALVSGAAASDEFDYFSNSWGLVGLKDYPSGCRITPDWHLQLADGIEAEVLIGGLPVPRRTRRTEREGLPIIESHLVVDDSAARVNVSAVPLPGRPWDYRLRTKEEDNFAVVVRVEAEKAGVSVRLLREGQALDTAVVETEEGRAFWLAFRQTEGVEEDLRRLAERGAEAVEQEALAYWRRLVAERGAEVSLPEEKALKTWRASLAYTFIGRDDGSVHAGEGFYDGYFLRDGAYQAWALELAGHLEEARPSVMETVAYQKPNGQLESQGGELDGNGQGLWNLFRHYAMTGNEAYLREVYPAIRKSMEWLTGALKREPGDPDAAFAGVLPKSWADGEALGKSDYHVVGYDIWNLRGALCAVEAAKALGERPDAEAWERLAEEYRTALLRLVEKTGWRSFPPSLELEGTDWGNLELIFPTPLFAAHDPRVSATLARARRGFVEGTIRWCPATTNAIHPYMSTFVTNSHVIRGEQERAVEGLYAFLLHTTSDDGFPEGVYYPSRTAWGDTVPHLWAAAMYVVLVRNMLIREEGPDLHFASAVPPDWLDPGKEVVLRRAPTTFGEAGLRMRAEGGTIHVRLEVPTERPPREVVLHFPPSLRVAGVKARQGEVVAAREDEVWLKPVSAELEVAITRRPAGRLSYEATVARYLSKKGLLAAQFRDLLPWPLAKEVDPERCVALDLRPVANVDPFTAPFGTLNPGKYLFTGLETGEVSVAGVPFTIIDPGENGGKGFVVLQGMATAEGFPKEATVEAGLVGERAFFLGQVTGWSPSDPGDAKHHAVGEYELVYEDGSKQRMPLVSGATADDWAMTPMAQYTQVGLKGDPWHLSVLAVRLRPKVLEKIIFRDHGTPASPLLAGVTVEREGY